MAVSKAIKPYLQSTFLICVIVLAVAAVSKDAVIEFCDIVLDKEAIPLKKSMDNMDELLLLPYKIVNRGKIENLDVLESLGTDEYIQWTLEDTEAGTYSPTRFCSLFVTYYTGNPDQVPHVPEECYVGSGYKQQTSQSLTLSIGKGQQQRDIKVKYLVFHPRNNLDWNVTNFARLYFFRANGAYANSREGVRAIMIKNLFGRYSYFSKVEWDFYGKSGYRSRIRPKQEETLEASEKLLRTLVPLLEKEHWPDWKQNDGRKDSTKKKLSALLTLTSFDIGLDKGFMVWLKD
ncbi:MAG: hypothetical protein FVQ79_06140 [Planctomycetes bacterium]|nr:hypothetical protein [Planctomycetota bacterium]